MSPTFFSYETKHIVITLRILVQLGSIATKHVSSHEQLQVLFSQNLPHQATTYSSKLGFSATTYSLAWGGVQGRLEQLI